MRERVLQTKFPQTCPKETFERQIALTEPNITMTKALNQSRPQNKHPIATMTDSWFENANPS